MKVLIAIVLLSTVTLLCVVEAYRFGSDQDPGLKRKWPELVGKTGEEAKAQIEKERPDLRIVEILPEGSPVTMDLRDDRVQSFVDEYGIVTQTPVVE